MPIPDEITKAIERAVDFHLTQWAPGAAEPTVATFAGKNYTITHLCDLIEIAGYSDETPPSMSEQLSKVFNDTLHGDLKTKFKNDPSYANAARCLRELVRRRRKAAGER